MLYEAHFLIEYEIQAYKYIKKYKKYITHMYTSHTCLIHVDFLKNK